MFKKNNINSSVIGTNDIPILSADFDKFGIVP